MSRANKYTEINYGALKTGDTVICGGRGPIAYFVKLFSAGFRKRHKKDVASHVGIVIDFHGQKLIVEMLGTEGHICLGSLEEYLKNKKRSIIDIRRFINMEDFDRRLIEQQAAYDIRKGLEYDYRGIAEFLFKKVDDDKSKAYCSELWYEYMKNIGKFFTKAQRTKFNKKISPEDINQIDTLVSLPWRKE